MNLPFSTKLYLGFSWMNVHIHQAWVQFNENRSNRKTRFWSERAHGLFKGRPDNTALNRAPIHKEKLMASARSGAIRCCYKAGYFHRCSDILQWNQFFCNITAPNGGQGRQHLAGARSRKHLMFIAAHSKGDMGLSDCVLPHDIESTCKLGGYGLKKMEPCRCIEEELFYTHRGSITDCSLLNRNDLTTPNLNTYPHFLIFWLRCQLEQRDGGDRGQRLTSKAHTLEGKRTVRRTNPGGRMAL